MCVTSVKVMAERGAIEVVVAVVDLLFQAECIQIEMYVQREGKWEQSQSAVKMKEGENGDDDVI